MADVVKLDLTACRAGRILREAGFENSYGVSDRRTADYRKAAAKTAAPARAVRQAAAADHSAGDDRGNPDLCAGDGEFLGDPAERPAGGGEYGWAGPGCAALRDGSGDAGAANPPQH